MSSFLHKSDGRGFAFFAERRTRREDAALPPNPRRFRKARDFLRSSLLGMLTGGGMSGGGFSPLEDAVARRQTAFLVWMGVLATLWIVFMFVPPC